MMKIDDFKDAQKDQYITGRLPEMLEISPQELLELWDKYLAKAQGLGQRRRFFNAALAIALRLTREGGADATT